MKSGAFISLVSEAYRVDEKTVLVYARALKEAGLLTTGARGINAPHLTPLDAARITIALLATDRPSQCVEAVRRFGGLLLQPAESKGKPPVFLAVTTGSTFESALTALFSADPFSDSPYIEIHENNRFARIEHAEGEVVFRNPSPTKEEALQNRRALGGIRRARGVAGQEYMNVWAAFYLERRAV